jgi:hypothetical protein
VRIFPEAYQDQAEIMGVIEEVSRYDDQLREARDKRLRHHIDELAGSIRALQRRGFADATLDPTLSSAVLGPIIGRSPEMWLMHEVLACSLDDAVEHTAKAFINDLGLEDSPD